MPSSAHGIAPDYPHHISLRGADRATIFCGHDDRPTYLKLLTNDAPQQGNTMI